MVKRISRKKAMIVRELLNGRKPAAIAKSYPLVTKTYIYRLAKELGRGPNQKHKPRRKLDVV